MTKTNFDDLELSQPGIEAGEINSASMAAGALLAANGSGAGQWLPGYGFACFFHDSEDTVTLGTTHDLHANGSLPIYSPGWTVDQTHNAILAPAGFDAQVAKVTVRVGFLTSGKTGSGRVTIKRSTNGGASFSSIGEVTHPLVEGTTVVTALGITEINAGDMIKAEFRPFGTPAGSGTLDVELGITLLEVIPGVIAVDW